MKLFSHLTRRGFIAASAAAMLSHIGKAADPSCTLTSEQEEGPYYVADEKLRADITEGRPGVPLRLRIALVDAKTCAPLPNAAVDIWHCDALGVYSAFTAASPDGGPAGRGRGSRNIDATRFCRGVQVTNSGGQVEFQSVYPGWYSGRAIHIHLKVHTGGGTEDAYSAGHVSHTGQMFFPEDLTAQIAKLEPYSTRLSIHRTTQEEDMVYNSQHGASVMLAMDRLKKGSNADGFLANITFAVNPDATPPKVGMGGRG